MLKVYSCNNNIELAAFKFALDAAGIKYLIKNEFVQGALGEIPPTDAGPEIWVLNESDQGQAKSLCLQVEAKQREQSADWQCPHCAEINASSFEYCWQCQGLRPE